MTIQKKSITILLAEDDPDDQMMVKEAFEENRILNSLLIVEDGEELMGYLHHSGKYADSDYKEPDLILLDLNMPKKDGREALKEIKADPHLRHIPIVVLTTSKAEEDIMRTYDLGVNSFIAKPVSFESLVAIVKAIKNYWFEIVELPPEGIGDHFELQSSQSTSR